jgi:hypothetical protein
LEIKNEIYKRAKAYYKIVNDNYVVRKMLSKIDYIRIFCEVDDFCKGFEG